MQVFRKPRYYGVAQKHIRLYFLVKLESDKMPKIDFNSKFYYSSVKYFC
jgi:hypothetical protein